MTRRTDWVRIVAFAFVPVAAAVAIYAGRFTLGGLLSAYGLLSVGRFTTQALMAGRVRARRPALSGAPRASIVVAVFNEEPHLFARAVESLCAQTYPGPLEIIVVDDGSDNAAENKETCNQYGVTYVWQPNAGKREALMTAFAAADPLSTFILTGDSDTIWHPDAATELIATLQSDRHIGAVTGHVDTLNPSDSWLTRLTSIRYWLAFEIERAAQSYHGVVTCVSGPLGGYRRAVLEQVKAAFIGQTFLGRTCTFGDDRHLTNLILGLGYEVHYSRALAWTEVPSRFSRYRSQQARWGRSHWRELLWTAKALPQHSLLLAVDWALTLVLPFLLVASLTWYAYLSVTVGPQALIRFLGMVVCMSLVRAVPAVTATREWRFLWLPVFALFHMAVLLPLKFWSLATVAARTWGTRAPAQVA